MDTLDLLGMDIGKSTFHLMGPHASRSVSRTTWMRVSLQWMTPLASVLLRMKSAMFENVVLSTERSAPIFFEAIQ